MLYTHIIVHVIIIIIIDFIVIFIFIIVLHRSITILAVVIFIQIYIFSVIHLCAWLQQPSIERLLVDVLTIGPGNAVFQSCLQGLSWLHPLRVHNVVGTLRHKHVHFV